MMLLQTESRHEKKCAEIESAFMESLRSIEDAMAQKFDEISKKMCVSCLLQRHRSYPA